MGIDDKSHCLGLLATVLLVLTATLKLSAVAEICRPENYTVGFSITTRTPARYLLRSVANASLEQCLRECCRFHDCRYVSFLVVTDLDENCLLYNCTETKAPLTRANKHQAGARAGCQLVSTRSAVVVRLPTLERVSKDASPPANNPDSELSDEEYEEMQQTVQEQQHETAKSEHHEPSVASDDGPVKQHEHRSESSALSHTTSSANSSRGLFAVHSKTVSSPPRLILPKLSDFDRHGDASQTARNGSSASHASGSSNRSLHAKEQAASSSKETQTIADLSYCSACLTCFYWQYTGLILSTSLLTFLFMISISLNMCQLHWNRKLKKLARYSSSSTAASNGSAANGAADTKSSFTNAYNQGDPSDTLMRRY